jgi:hypothetical protein
MISEKDKKQLKEKGISLEQARWQSECFKKGFAPARLSRPARLGDGILQLNSDQANEYAAIFEKESNLKEVMKFVPASGAATRMFRDLFSWRKKLKAGLSPEELEASDAEARKFFSDLKSFAFWEDLALVMNRDCVDADHMLNEGHYITILDYLLFEYGLDYAALPKGLLLFHKYGKTARTSFEEHLVEAAAYARNANGVAKVHFTVSPEHQVKFEKLAAQMIPHFEREFGLNYDISFSTQKTSTDTMAVDLSNEPFRESDGSLVLRPAGHGALIENLNELAADLVFIKNIDNVVPDHIKQQTVLYKKALGGLLLKLQQQVFEWINRLENDQFDNETCSEVFHFAVSKLNLDPESIKGNANDCRKQLLAFLKRPIRVCGMVKNEGEPGGGPFWVSNSETDINTLQIVESAQVDLNEPGQLAIFNASTHFNPVDLVCSLKDHVGNKFDLSGYVDRNSGLISTKTKDGKELKALELPGLWNGAMAHWITVFVEVPLITFNPVKTINDLLRKEHR